MPYYNNYDNDNKLFISSQEELLADIAPEEIGKEFIFLTKKIHCPECDKDLKKSFISQQKAQDYADKHSNTKKYGSHNPVVQEIVYDFEVTIRDIAGTPQNYDKIKKLRDRIASSLVFSAEQVIAKYEKTIADIATIFKTEYIGSNLDDFREYPLTTLKSIKLKFQNAREFAHVDIEDLIIIRDLVENRKEIYCDAAPEITIEGFKFNGKDIDSVWERATHIHFHVKPSKGYRDECYSWEYDYDLTPLVGFNEEEIPDCPFCNLPIKSHNDILEDIHGDTSSYIDSNTLHKLVHRDCNKHITESRNLYSYAEKLVKEKEIVA